MGDLSEVRPKMNPDFTAILTGYRRIAIAIGIVVIGIVVARALVFFHLAGPAVADLLPAASLLMGAVLLTILGYGHRWLSRRLLQIEREVEEARARSHRDALTGVFTRAYFLEALGVHVFHGSQTPVGYLQIDMDNLKVLNDSAGHAAGDTALVHLTKVIEQVMPGALVGRLGGDEFGVMIAGHDNKAALRRLGEALLRALERPVSIGGRLVRLSASIGVALSPQDAIDAVDLISKADLALYRGKKDGRHAVVSFDADMLGDERHRRFVERRDQLTLGAETPADLIGVGALHQRLGLDPGNVVVAAAVATLDEGNIAKAGGRDIGDLGAAARQERVGGNRRAETDLVDAGNILHLSKPLKHAFDRFGGRRQVLPVLDGAGRRIVGNEVGERSPNIDADDFSVRHCSLFSHG